VGYDGVALSGSRGNLTRRIEPPIGGNRNTTVFKYDAKDNLIQTVAPKGVNSGNGIPGSEANPCGVAVTASATTYATDLAYDSASQMKLESTTHRFADPDLGQQTAVTKFEYTDSQNPGLVTKVVPPRGNTGGSPNDDYATLFTYNASGCQAGLLASAESALVDINGSQARARTTHTYDCVGRRTSMVDPLGNASGGVPAQHTWEYTYDNEDRPRLTKAPAPQAGGGQLVTDFRYDAVGNRTVAIDTNGQVTKYVYDSRDSLQEVQQTPDAWTDPNVTPTGLIVTSYEYDDLGNLKRVQRAQNNAAQTRTTDYASDGLNRLRKETQYPNWPSTSPTLVTEYTYDGNGNRLTLKDPLNRTTTFTYDALDRLTTIDYSDAGTPDVGYGYDRHGNRTSMQDGIGTTTYAHDELDRLLSVTSPTDAGNKTVAYRYDLDGNRRKVLYPDNTAVTYTFDKASRMESLLDWASRGTSYQYFADGRLKQATHPNTTRAEYAYDHARRLTQVWHQQAASYQNTVSRHTYTLDSAGNRTRADEVLPQPGAPGPIAGSPWGENLLVEAPSLEALTLELRALLQLAPSPTPAASPGASPTATASPSPTETASPSPTATGTPAASPTATGTAVATATPSPDGTPTPVATPTATLATTLAASLSPTPTEPPAVLLTATPRATTTPTATPTGTAPLGPTPTAASTTQTVALADRSGDPAWGYRYGARVGGSRVGLFGKASGAADAWLQHHSGTSLRFALPGTPTLLAAGGATATAQVGTVTARWTSLADRLKEDLVLASRPAGDQVSFGLETQGLHLVSDGSGGYRAQDAHGQTLFHLLAPTVHDALGRTGTAKLSIVGTTATLGLDPAFLAAAAYPVTVDPTVLYTGVHSDGTAYVTSLRLVRDNYGKLLLISVRGGDFALVASWSNDGGQTWSSSASSLTGWAPTWSLTPEQTGLDLVCDCGEALKYGRWSISRDASQNITAVSAPASLLQLETGGTAPSLVRERNGGLAVAWAKWSGSREVRFLRSVGDPSLRANWKNAQGTSTSPDSLGALASASLPSLQRMPAGAAPSANDDGLYAFWVGTNGQLRWSKALASGPDYTAWSSPSDKAAAVDSDHSVATAADPQYGGIVFAYHTADPGEYRVARKLASNDANASDVLLLGSTPAVGDQLSLGVDRGDLYAFYLDAQGRAASRRFTPEQGWSSEAALSEGAVRYPTARQDLSDGQVDAAWVTASTPYSLVHQRTAGSRPLVQGLAANPSPFDASAGQTTTESHSNADGQSSSLSVTVQVLDCTGNVVERQPEPGQSERGLGRQERRRRAPAAGRVHGPGDRYG
jgi:YD repeat-containing protein